jgi:hypothetical protein
MRLGGTGGVRETSSRASSSGAVRAFAVGFAGVVFIAWCVARALYYLGLLFAGAGRPRRRRFY